MKTKKLWQNFLGTAIFATMILSGYAQTVSKTVYDGNSLWSVGQWNKAKGKTSIESENGAKNGKALKIETSFSGKDFEFAGYDINPDLIVPGRTKKIIVRAKTDSPEYSFVLNLKDGWERGGKEFEKPLKFSQDFQNIEITIPANWIQPLTIVGVGTHNWGKQSEKKITSLWIDEIIVETDISEVELSSGVLKGWTPDPSPKEPAKSPKECPRTNMISVEMTPTVEYGVFAGEEPSITLSMRNWLPNPLKGVLSWQISDYDGNKIGSLQKKDISAESMANFLIPLSVQKFGLYTVNVALQLSDGKTISKEMKVAKVPRVHKLTREQKIASPYGMNVHSGGKIVLEPFMKAGIVWFREYAFNYEWLLRAKGDDKTYNGWPYYPKIVQAYRDLDAMVLPVIQKSIKAPQVKDGQIVEELGPDAKWKKEIADVIQAFPDIQYWELSNEYDLDAGNRRAEELCGWKNYQLYHETFANILKALEVMGGGPYFAIENGRAGIWTDLLKDCILSGHFTNIFAVNSHHYCGVDAPERNFMNANMNQVLPKYFFDNLREQKRVASADGKKRQSWFTEFGWDILAGKIVTPYEQAVYLPRAWMIQLAAGTDKCFWFYNFDSPTPKVYFDGMGLLDARGEPKANLCSLAGITHILPLPKYIGSINAGSANTHGYVFENDGKLVASIYTIKGDNGPEVSFKEGQLFDWFANPLAGRKANLTMAPVYLVGLSKEDPFYLQTAYEIETPHLMSLSPADKTEIVVRVNNNRNTVISGNVSIQAPNGWETSTTRFDNLQPKQSKDLILSLKIPNKQKLGETSLSVICSENDKQIKVMPLSAFIRPGAIIAAPALKGAPGKTEINVVITNQGLNKLKNAKLKLELPDTWKAELSEFVLPQIDPNAKYEQKIALEWSNSWNPNQSALLRLVGENDLDISAPIIPSEYRLLRAKDNLKIDGDLSDWQPEAEMPQWMLGRKINDAEGRLFFAWSPDGLYGAVEVKSSKLINKSPSWFWACDALELFIDTKNDKSQRTFVEGDHQFWFVPLPDENRVYVGQWKRGSELSANREDIKNIKSSAKRKGEGYVMEFLLPASEMKLFKAEAGVKIGLNLNLTVFGKPMQDEIFWPNSKDSGLCFQPPHFGTLELKK